MAKVAKDAGLGRESLYKAIAPGSHPRFETVSAILRALNVHMEIAARTFEQIEAIDQKHILAVPTTRRRKKQKAGAA